MSRETVLEFLKEKQMLFESFDRKEMEDRFIEDMTKRESLLMSNSHQKTGKEGNPEGDILVIDMGGTNYRLAIYNNGTIRNEIKKPMYAIDRELDGDEFIDLIAKDIEEYPIKKVGFCFSYEITSTPDKDAVIVHLAKEIKLRNIKGKILGEELNKRLSLKREFSILNDTVAAQLGVNADVGIIIGTGFNIAFTDTNLDSIVDAECGQYVFFPKGQYDEAMHTIYPDTLPCVEKQVSGAYLGMLIKLCSEGYLKRILPEFNLVDVTNLFSNRGKLCDYLTDDEIKDFLCIVNCIEERAADYIALQLKCLLTRNSQKMVRIALEGSTIYNLPGYYDALVKSFKKGLGREFEMVDARDCIFEGCARSTI